MTNKFIKIKNKLPILFFAFSAMTIFFSITGCNTIFPKKTKESSVSKIEQKEYELAHLSSEQCKAFLNCLDITNIRYVPKSNILFLSGTKDQLKKADVVIDVVDSSEKYCVENLGDSSLRSALPANGRIAARLGNIDIGTFNEPPVKSTKERAIIDIHKNSLLAFVPVSYRGRLFKLLAEKDIKVDSQKAVLAETEPNENLLSKTNNNIVSESSASVTLEPEAESEEVNSTAQSHEITGFDISNNNQSTTIVSLSEMADPKDVDVNAMNVEIQPQSPLATENELPKTVTITFKTSQDNSKNPAEKILTGKAEPENGEDLLELNLPESLTLIQLLDLAGKHLGLNYVYDNKLISNQPVTLKLNGNLQGQMKIKNLYALS